MLGKGIRDSLSYGFQELASIDPREGFSDETFDPNSRSDPKYIHKYHSKRSNGTNQSARTENNGRAL